MTVMTGPPSPKRIYLSPPHVGEDERGAPSRSVRLELDRPARTARGRLRAGDVRTPWRRPRRGPVQRDSGAPPGAADAGGRPGDEVLVSTLTFSATANAVTYCGAAPVFVDCDPGSWYIDPALLAEELALLPGRGKHTEAVIAVDLYGQCADYDPILRRARGTACPWWRTRPRRSGRPITGSRRAFGAVAVFSFNGNKIITTSGGGMLVSRSAGMAEHARFLATQARDPAPHYQHSQIGYNYRMTNLLAAVGRGQLRVLPRGSRSGRSSLLSAALGELPGISFMPTQGTGIRITGSPASWSTPPFGATREEIRLALEAENIESRPIWKPMHLQPVFKDCRVRGGSVSEGIFRDGLCLPSGTALTDVELQRIAGIFRSVSASIAGLRLHRGHG